MWCGVVWQREEKDGKAAGRGKQEMEVGKEDTLLVQKAVEQQSSAPRSGNAKKACNVSKKNLGFYQVDPAHSLNRHRDHGGCQSAESEDACCCAGRSVSVIVLKASLSCSFGSVDDLMCR